MITKTTSIGELMTLDAAAKAKGSTYPATYRWARRKGIPLLKVGPILMVKLSDLEGYRPRV